MSRVEDEPGAAGRSEVVKRVGAAIARRFEESGTDAAPQPILAEGSVMCTLPETTPAARTPAHRWWPYAAAAAVVLAIAGAGGYAAYSAQHAAEVEAARYPVVATPAERVILEREAARWHRGSQRLLASLASFDAPPLSSLTGVGACPLAITPPADGDAEAAASTRIILLPEESMAGLDAQARPEVDTMLRTAARGRFHDEAARTQVMHALVGSFVVVVLAEHRAPAETPGVAAGTAYAFDPATGSLACAGTFRAESSTVSGLELQTDRAIARSLRAIDGL